VSLAALGLYGLMSLNVAGRVREFSIRKVLGAGVKSVTGNLTGQYLLLLIIALAIGAPISYYLSDMILGFAYEYHMAMDPWGVTFSIALLTFVLFATISSQVRKIFLSNAVEGLKVE
jgi:ABC-type antimicrobial peptide transport system permease subunit